MPAQPGLKTPLEFIGPARFERRANWIARLALHNFRCHAKTELEAGPEPVILLGRNGAGKTSALEALSYLGVGRGMLQTPLGDLTRLGSEGWSVSALLARPDGAPVRLGVGINPEGRARRQLRIGGKPARASSEFAAFIRPLWLTPAMERLMARGQHALRRNLLDRLALALDPAHGLAAARARRAAAQRRRFLLDGHSDRVWLETAERDLARTALALTSTRLETARTLNSLLAANPSAPVQISLEGPLPSLAAEPEAVEQISRLLARERDKPRHASLLHQTRIRLTHASGREAGLCSTGERKIMLASIILAAARAVRQTGASPLLLLDDIAAHLDSRLRERFFAACEELGVQFWATGSDKAQFARLESRARFLALETPGREPTRPAQTSLSPLPV